MEAHAYHCPGFVEGRNELPPEEAHHAASVMRLRSGDALVVFDGEGRWAGAVVNEAGRRSVTVEVTSLPQVAPSPAPPLHLHLAIPKAARQHMLIEKCTELGVTTIEAVVTEHSVVRPTAGGAEKWRRYAIEAAKQSRQWWLPKFPPARSFDESLAAAEADAIAVIASPGAHGRPIYEALQPACAAPHAIHAWIGPEGGFTDWELAAATEAGVTPVSLGESVLRVETAAIAVAALVRLAIAQPS